jgi:hypothetical protein
MCGVYCLVGFLQRKQARVTHRAETAIRADSTATWNGVNTGVSSSSISSVSSIISMVDGIS